MICAKLPEGGLSPRRRRSDVARERMLAQRGERLFVAAWRQVLMIHFEVEAAALQREVPFQLDLWRGRAFVSLVAFTMRGLRPVAGGKLAAWMFRPIATHDFLNVRTYVRHGGETGIHFLAEWLSCRLAASLGPVTYSLPYRHGRLDYQNDCRTENMHGTVVDARSGTQLCYRIKAPLAAPFCPCPTGSLDEWLMERYQAFNSAGLVKRRFRVWHPTWQQCSAKVDVGDDSLLTEHWPWFRGATLIGANYSPGFPEVWMGRPHFCLGSNAHAGRFRHGAFFGESA